MKSETVLLRTRSSWFSRSELGPQLHRSHHSPGISLPSISSAHGLEGYSQTIPDSKVERDRLARSRTDIKHNSADVGCAAPGPEYPACSCNTRRGGEALRIHRAAGIKERIAKFRSENIPVRLGARVEWWSGSDASIAKLLISCCETQGR